MTEAHLRRELRARLSRALVKLLAVGIVVLACAWPTTALYSADAAITDPSATAAPEADDDADDDARLPPYLRGVDLDLPAQDCFRAWPGASLTERPYWLPWNWFSFQRAKLFNRPVLLVLTVGWSRLALRLDEETFADPRVLKSLNEGYLAVRVDADRRPDIRERYHTGAWPSLSLLLPDAKPILSHANPTGKALPITAGFLKPEEMLFLLREGRTYYEKWWDLLAGVGKEWAKIEAGPDPAPGAADFDASDRMARWLLGNVDHAGGGFGAAPKFLIAGLSEYAALRAERGAPALMDHAALTLDKLIASPLYDRRDGGIHRIASQPDWGGIQYEKLLAQNAALIRELSFALRVRPATDSAGDAHRREALAGTARFLTGVLARPDGGFVVAQAAAGGGAKSPPRINLVLAGDSALAGAALVRAALALDDPAFEVAGKKAIDRVLRTTYEAGRGSGHVVEPHPDGRRYLVTQAELAFALVDAYETTGEFRYLRAGKDVADFALQNLAVAGETAVRDVLPEVRPMGLLVNPRRPLQENVRLARALVRLAALGQGAEYAARARAILGTYAGDLSSFGIAGLDAALAIEEAWAEPIHLTIDGAPENRKTIELRRAALALGRAGLVVASGSIEAKPAAVIQWKSTTTRVDRADRLEAEIRRIVEPQAPGGPS